MMLKWPRFFNRTRQTPRSESVDTAVLPRSIMEAIVDSQDHTIGKKEILRLVRDGEGEPTLFANAALYCIFKANESRPDVQEAMLQRVVDALKEVPSHDEAAARAVIRGVVERFTRELPEEERISGAKLKRLNLGGFRNWDDRYAREAARLANDSREVFIVANSMLLGLSPFVRHFREQGKPLLIPHNMPNGVGGGGIRRHDNYPMGYTILANGSVTPFGSGFVRPERAVIVDDIRREGYTEKQITEFWNTNGDAPPEFEPLEVMENKL
jgi:hypothetical protein